MTDGKMLVDERELIAELMRYTSVEGARLRAVCEAVFGNGDVADLPHVVHAATAARRVCMENPRSSDAEPVGRVYGFRDSLREVSATIHGGPPRMLRLASVTP